MKKSAKNKETRVPSNSKLADRLIGALAKMHIACNEALLVIENESGVIERLLIGPPTSIGGRRPAAGGVARVC